jgi:tagatose 1,6-diphosphate aldolase
MGLKQLSVGKIRGFASTTNLAGSFSILAFDHRQSFIKLLNPWGSALNDYPTIAAAKSQFVRLLAPHASAVLLDPVFGAAQAIVSDALPGETGLIVSLEETGYTGTDTARETTFLSNWSIQKTKRMGADAVKLLVYYHPEAGQIAEKQETLIRQVIEECRRQDILFFLEIVTYSCDPGVQKSSPEFARNLPTLIPTIAQRLGDLSPDILKLEFPLNVRYEPDVTHWLEACQAVSAASPCPWTLLSAAADFETFTRQVDIACQAGASGFIAGRAVWQEAVSMPDEQRERWLAEVGAVRLDRLTEIASRNARPWRDFYPDLADTIAEDWYIRYDN